MLEHIKLPNIRELFIPDPGMIMADVDLDRADAQIVAWESGEPMLKEALRMGVDTHLLNAHAISGMEPPDLSWLVEGHSEYSRIKKEMGFRRARAKMWCHGTNYGGSARTMAANTGITIAESEQARKYYFGMFPGILTWHRRVERQLQTTRTVSNKFGYNRYYFERIDGLLPQALAWIPQSTVGLVINEALENIDRELPDVQILLQVHDSLVMQFPEEQYTELLPKIHECMQITIPYDEPLIIPSGMKASRKSWAHCQSVTWDGSTAVH